MSTGQMQISSLLSDLIVMNFPECIAWPVVGAGQHVCPFKAREEGIFNRNNLGATLIGAQKETGDILIAVGASTRAFSLLPNYPRQIPGACPCQRAPWCQLCGAEKDLFGTGGLRAHQEVSGAQLRVPTAQWERPVSGWWQENRPLSWRSVNILGVQVRL